MSSQTILPILHTYEFSGRAKYFVADLINFFLIKLLFCLDISTGHRLQRRKTFIT